MEIEAKSTGFMLKLLSESVISAWGVNTKLSFKTTAKNGELTGYWKNDSQYFDIVPLDNVIKLLEKDNITGFVFRRHQN